MSNCRYYIVGNNDKWMIQFKDTENGQYRAVTTRPHSRSLLRKSLACGERAPTYACSMMMAACDANGAGTGNGVVLAIDPKPPRRPRLYRSSG